MLDAAIDAVILDGSMIKFLPDEMLAKIAPVKKIKKLLKSNISLKKTALSFVNDIEFLDKKGVVDTALKVIKGYKKRIEVADQVRETDIKEKFNLSPDVAKQYGYNSKSTGLTALSEKMPDGPDTALIDYSENKYKIINKELRSGELTNATKEYVADIDKSFEISVIKKDTTLYRGVKADVDISKLKPGSSFQDSAYLSTSPNKNIASSFAKSFEGNGALFEIETNIGQSAVDLTSIKTGIIKGEQEILLPRDTKFKVTEILERDGLKVIKMKVVDDPQASTVAKKPTGEEIEDEILKDPKLLVQRVQNEIVFQIHDGIKQTYGGEKAIWLPSSALDPRPEHQLLYGQEYIIGEGIDGLEPGDEYGCQCGMEILVDGSSLEI